MLAQSCNLLPFCPILNLLPFCPPIHAFGLCRLSEGEDAPATAASHVISKICTLHWPTRKLFNLHDGKLEDVLVVAVAAIGLPSAAFVAPPVRGFGGLPNYRSTTEEPVVLSLDGGEIQPDRNAAAACFVLCVPLNIGRQQFLWVESSTEHVGSSVVASMLDPKIAEAAGLSGDASDMPTVLPDMFDDSLSARASTALAESEFSIGSSEVAFENASQQAQIRNIQARLFTVELQMRQASEGHSSQPAKRAR